MLGEAGKQEILQQMFWKFQISNMIAFRTVIFRKLTLGAPETWFVAKQVWKWVVNVQYRHSTRYVAKQVARFCCSFYRTFS